MLSTGSSAGQHPADAERDAWRAVSAYFHPAVQSTGDGYQFYFGAMQVYFGLARTIPGRSERNPDGAGFLSRFSAFFPALDKLCTASGLGQAQGTILALAADSGSSGVPGGVA